MTLRSRIISAFSCFCATLFGATSAQAWEWSVEAYVTVVEGSYLPEQVPFQIDLPAGNCISGSWLSWVIRGTDSPARYINAQAVFSVLLTAKGSHRRVKIFGNNAECAVEYIHLI